MTGVPFRNTASQTTNFQPRRTVDGRSKQVFRLTGPQSGFSPVDTHAYPSLSTLCQVAKRPSARAGGTPSTPSPHRESISLSTGFRCCCAFEIGHDRPVTVDRRPAQPRRLAAPLTLPWSELSTLFPWDWPRLPDTNGEHTSICGRHPCLRQYPPSCQICVAMFDGFLLTTRIAHFSQLGRFIRASQVQYQNI